MPHRKCVVPTNLNRTLHSYPPKLDRFSRNLHFQSCRCQSCNDPSCSSLFLLRSLSLHSSLFLPVCLCVSSAVAVSIPIWRSSSWKGVSRRDEGRNGSVLLGRGKAGAHARDADLTRRSKTMKSEVTARQLKYND